MILLKLHDDVFFWRNATRYNALMPFQIGVNFKKRHVLCVLRALKITLIKSDYASLFLIVCQSTKIFNMNRIQLCKITHLGKSVTLPYTTSCMDTSASHEKLDYIRIYYTENTS